jgi:hypothetical protein
LGETPVSDERMPPEAERREGHWGPFGPHPGRNGPVIAGVILVALGVIFLAQNFGYPVPRNWWAIFILLPAAAALSAAWSMYQRNGGVITPPVRGSLTIGIVLTGLAVLFLLGIEIGKFWPVILIIVGGALLFGTGWRRGDGPPRH